jgi:hypothetical protein
MPALGSSKSPRHRRRILLLRRWRAPGRRRCGSIRGQRGDAPQRHRQTTPPLRTLGRQGALDDLDDAHVTGPSNVDVRRSPTSGRRLRRHLPARHRARGEDRAARRTPRDSRPRLPGGVTCENADVPCPPTDFGGKRQGCAERSRRTFADTVSAVDRAQSYVGACRVLTRLRAQRSMRTVRGSRAAMPTNRLLSGFNLQSRRRASSPRRRWAVPVRQRPCTFTRTRGSDSMFMTHDDAAPSPATHQKLSPRSRPPTGVCRRSPVRLPVVSITPKPRATPAHSRKNGFTAR